jgi:large subunit ribosomal protein L15
MKVHELRPPAGSNRSRKRVGRGIAGKGGKTAGRGTKGQGARDTIPMGFEGGQLPLLQRIPKLRGFKNPFAHKGDLVKVLGGGELPRALRVEVHAFSKSAEAAITGAGGSISIVPLPFGNDRPPAKGNALTNR